MAKQNYLNRMMTSRDPRFHRIGRLLGASKPKPVETIDDLRARYVAKFGRRPFNGWDKAELKKRIETSK